MVCFFTTFHSNTVFKSFFVTRKLVRYYYLFNNYFNDINWIHRTMKCKLFNTNITKFFTSFYIIKKLKNIMIKFSFLSNILFQLHNLTYSYIYLFHIYLYIFFYQLIRNLFLISTFILTNILNVPFYKNNCNIIKLIAFCIKS